MLRLVCNCNVSDGIFDNIHGKFHAFPDKPFINIFTDKGVFVFRQSVSTSWLTVVELFILKKYHFYLINDLLTFFTPYYQDICTLFWTATRGNKDTKEGHPVKNKTLTQPRNHDEDIDEIQSRYSWGEQEKVLHY